MKKKRFMLLITSEEGQSAYFYDTYLEIEDARMNAECCLGDLAEVYERTMTDYGIIYEFLYS